jgi:serine/threonine protein phosphatase PrpC
MEDSHIATKIDITDDEFGWLFAVFDGHGGKEVAEVA